MTYYLTTGVLLGLSAGLSPGPLMALVISQSLKHGSREGAKAALAPLITDIPIILLSVMLLSRLAHYRPLLGVFSLGGALFVAWLALETVRTVRVDLDRMPEPPKSLVKGATVNLLSPHPYLFWLMVGAPVMVKGWHASTLAAGSFLLGFYVCLVGSKLVVALLAGRAGEFLSGRTYAWLMRLMSGLLFLFALLLAKDGLALLKGLP